MMQLSEIGIWVHLPYDKPRRRGDFDIFVHKDKKIMLIPVDLYNFIISECGARNAEAAMDFLCSRPQTVARLLGWTEEEVKTAFKKLVAHVHGVLNMPQPTTTGKRGGK